MESSKNKLPFEQNEWSSDQIPKIWIQEKEKGNHDSATAINNLSSSPEGHEEMLFDGLEKEKSKLLQRLRAIEHEQQRLRSLRSIDTTGEPISKYEKGNRNFRTESTKEAVLEDPPSLFNEILSSNESSQVLDQKGSDMSQVSQSKDAKGISSKKKPKARSSVDFWSNIESESDNEARASSAKTRSLLVNESNVLSISKLGDDDNKTSHTSTCRTAFTTDIHEDLSFSNRVDGYVRGATDASDVDSDNVKAKIYDISSPTMPRRSILQSTRATGTFRISKDLSKQRKERIEAFFYNHGMEIALGVLFLAANVLGAAHGAYQFTAAGGWTTDDHVLRITLPIARAGGRLVTINCAILLITACKYLWTCIRTYIAPVIPIGFPIDNVMPKYHRYVALTVIFSGCIIHTLPQIVNYASKSIPISTDGFKIWTFGNGFATQQLFVTGILLTLIFSTFFFTTLKAFRKTANGFRWFWFFHMGGIAAAYPLLIIHGTCRGHPVFLYVGLLPLLMYIFDVLMRRSKVTKTNVLEWNTYDDEGQEITELVVECPDNFTYTAGQYAELNFPPISKTEWHPFTIASAPNEEEDNGINNKSSQKQVVFYIKNVGRWTGALYNYASAFDLKKAKKNTKIFIRGPHGAPAMNYFEYKHIVVIGSGVGITPLLSIWKYLVSKGRTMNINTSFRARADLGQVGLSPYISGDDSSTDSEDEKDKFMLLIVRKFLESMMVSICLLILFVLGETITLVLQIFGVNDAANSIGVALSLIALVVHGILIIASGVTLGCFIYVRLLRCWLECGIVILDSFALWYSLVAIIGVNEDDDQERGMDKAYFIFFGLVIFLHSIRIFHIFYLNLKHDVDKVTKTSMKKQSTLKSSGRGQGKRLSFNRTIPGQQMVEEICSVQGIAINRMYSNMRFAARSLLPSILEDGVSDVFSFEFFGTREKPEDENTDKLRVSKRLIGNNGVCSTTDDDNIESKIFIPGRPDWTSIFMRALARAHATNSCGESVGVFFCGSPAIAKVLNETASKVTSQHQYSMKNIEGVRCKCKVIVHSENF